MIHTRTIVIFLTHIYMPMSHTMDMQLWSRVSSMLSRPEVQGTMLSHYRSIWLHINYGVPAHQYKNAKKNLDHYFDQLSRLEKIGIKALNDADYGAFKEIEYQRSIDQLCSLTALVGRLKEMIQQLPDEKRHAIEVDILAKQNDMLIRKSKRFIQELQDTKSAYDELKVEFQDFQADADHFVSEGLPELLPLFYVYKKDFPDEDRYEKSLAFWQTFGYVIRRCDKRNTQTAQLMYIGDAQDELDDRLNNDASEFHHPGGETHTGEVDTAP